MLTPEQESALTSNNGERVAIKTAEGLMDAYIFAAEGQKPAVVMFMDAFGVRPALFEMARKLADSGFFVLLPNLYYRHGNFEPFDVPTAFSSDRDRIMGMMMSVTPAVITRDFGSILDYLENQAGAEAERVGLVGYCMGGPLALTVAATYSSRVKATASIHGGRLATESEDSPHHLADMLSGKVYIGVADKDASFDQSQRERLLQAFDAAGVDYQLEDYPGAQHGFAVPDLSVYDQQAADKHWQRLQELFSTGLQSEKTE